MISNFEIGIINAVHSYPPETEHRIQYLFVDYFQNDSAFVNKYIHNLDMT